MNLRYFTEEAYNDLYYNIQKNLPNYSSKDEWLDAYFKNSSEYYKTSSVEVGDFAPIYKTDDKNAEDIENVKKLYEAFKNLTPLQASNKYLWTYLCHGVKEYREYVQKRWMQDARENTVKNRFFATTTSSLLNDNALSRLWWYGYLTYDRKNDNYDLTEILLTNQTICTDVMDTNNRMNFNRMRGVLWAIRDFKTKISNGEGITDYFRECKKFLNHYGAVINLEFLSSEEIQNLALTYMKNLRNEKQKANLAKQNANAVKKNANAAKRRPNLAKRRANTIKRKKRKN